MEHRWGQRIAVAIPVQVWPSSVVCEQPALLANLSLSGGWIAATINARRFSTIKVLLEVPELLSNGPHAVNAYVVRQTLDGIGVEWHRHSPEVVVRLFHALARSGPVGAALNSPNDTTVDDRTDDK